MLQHAATHCNTLHQIVENFYLIILDLDRLHCNILQHIATHYNTLQYIATLCRNFFTWLNLTLSGCTAPTFTSMPVYHVTYRWTTSRMSHVTRESCHIWPSRVTCEWVMSHLNETCHIRTSHVKYECVMSHINESCHIQMSHVTF